MIFFFCYQIIRIVFIYSSMDFYYPLSPKSNNNKVILYTKPATLIIIFKYEIVLINLISVLRFRLYCYRCVIILDYIAVDVLLF